MWIMCLPHQIYVFAFLLHFSFCIVCILSTICKYLGISYTMMSTALCYHGLKTEVITKKFISECSMGSRLILGILVLR